MSECYFTRENQWYRMHEFQFFLFSRYVRFWLLISCWHISLAKTCWRQNLLRQKTGVKISIQIAIRIILTTCQLSIGIPNCSWHCHDCPTTVVIPISEHDSWQFWNIIMSIRAFFLVERLFDMKMTDIQLDRSTGKFDMWSYIWHVICIIEIL